MITERHLNHILKEMDYAIVSLATEFAKAKVPDLGKNETFISIKYLQEKVALLKFHVDWIRVDMEEDET